MHDVQNEIRLEIKILFGSLLTYISAFISQFSSLNPQSHISYSNSQFSINSITIVFGIKTWLKFLDKKRNFVSVWIGIICVRRFVFCIFHLFFSFFFHAFQEINFIVYALFMGSKPLYSEIYIYIYIKNRFHSTIYIFKNYFATIFSVFNKIKYIQTDPISKL